MKIFKYLFLFTAAIAALLLTTGCGGSFTASGNLVDETYDYSDFSLIEAGDGFTLEIVRSDSFGVTVTADDNLMEKITVEKDGDTLLIEFNGTCIGATLEAMISMPVITGINLDGGAQASITGFESTEDFSVTLSGGSILEGDIVCGDIGFGISGGSHVSLAGSGNTLMARSSDGSEMQMADFSVVNADINIDAGGTAFLDISGRLDTVLTAGSSLTYTGDAEKGEINVSGGSTLTQE